MSAHATAADVLSAVAELAESRAVGAPSLTADLPLFQAGVLDSFGMIELIELLERRFQVRFAAEDLTMDNFRTGAEIAALVERRRAA